MPRLSELGLHKNHKHYTPVQVVKHYNFLQLVYFAKISSKNNSHLNCAISVAFFCFAVDIGVTEKLKNASGII